MIRIGILGAGYIAAIMARTIRMMEDPEICLYAVASRDRAKAEAFARQWEVPRAYGGYEEMLGDEKVTLVYVATPHSHHRDHALLCARYGKHALVEKAFCVNEKQAAEVIVAFEKQGLLVAEAIWTRYQPMRALIRQAAFGGEAGEPKMIRASLHYAMAQKERIRRPELAGGALLDVGIYPLNFADMVFGPPEKYQAFGVLSDTGVDLSSGMMLGWDGGRMAMLSGSACCQADEDAYIDCDAGYIQVRNVNNPEWLRVYGRNRELIREQACPPRLTGYEYEVLECAEMIRQRRTECPSMPHADTLRLMRMMDGMRAQLGVRYPFE